MARKTKDLVQIIRDNPGCVAVIDNDYWWLYKVSPSENPFDEDNYEDWDDFTEKEKVKVWNDGEKWEKENELASSDDTFKPRLGDGGYGSGHCYGGDILQALAVIVGIKVESV